MRINPWLRRLHYCRKNWRRCVERLHPSKLASHWKSVILLPCLYTAGTHSPTYHGRIYGVRTIPLFYPIVTIISGTHLPPTSSPSVRFPAVAYSVDGVVYRPSTQILINPTISWSLRLPTQGFPLAFPAYLIIH